MKTIGLIGGMSWESTVPYYRRINERVKQRLGGLHSARVVLYSVDFHDIETLQQAGRWDEAGGMLAKAAKSLEAAGADFLVLCTNTMHKVAAAIEAAVAIPLLHIADPTAAAVKQAGMRTIGLLGTRFTMEQDFYRGRLESMHGIKVLVPEADDRQAVHRVIYDELCLGVISDASRARYRQIIARLARRGAEGVILGCTEIAMLVSPSDADIPLFDTTSIHADSAVDFAICCQCSATPPDGDIIENASPMSFDDLLNAFEWVSSGAERENAAYVSRPTGKIYWSSLEIDPEDKLPENIDDVCVYVPVPHKNDLDLGRNLVFRFVQESLPDSADVIAGFFRKPGAYGRFKEFLERHGRLNHWFEFETKAVEDALREWSRANGLPLKV